MVDIDNMPVAFDECQFGIGDLVILTGVTKVTIENWTKRDIIVIGEMPPGRGWRRFSLSDAIVLAVVDGMVAAGVTPARAAPCAVLAAHMAKGLGGTAENTLMIAFAADGSMVPAAAYVKPGGLFLPRFGREPGFEAFKRPFLCVPVLPITLEIFERLDLLPRFARTDTPARFAAVAARLEDPAIGWRMPA